MSAGALGDFVLKVTPEVLRTKSDQVQTEITNMRQHFEVMTQSVSRSISYWVGEACDLHRSIYEARKPEIEEMFLRFGEHVRDLNLMAQEYQTAEDTIIDAGVDPLPTEVIL